MTDERDLQEAWAIIEREKGGPVDPDIRATIAAALAKGGEEAVAAGSPLQQAIIHLRQNPSWDLAGRIVSTFDLLR